jgi:AraC-like DNA-binding protein
MYEIFQIILAMGTAWAISGLLRLSVFKRNTDTDAKYASAVIFVFLLTILDNLLRPSFISMSFLRVIYPVTRLSYFLVGPILYLYTQILLKENFKLKFRDLLHLIPFGVWFVYVILDPNSINPAISFGVDNVNSPAIKLRPEFSFSFIWDLTLNMSRLIYSGIILWMLNRHGKSIKDEYSTINRTTTLSWFKYLVLFYTGIYLLNSVLNLSFPIENQMVQIFSAIVRGLPAVLFVFFFSLFSEDQRKLVEVNFATEEGHREQEEIKNETKYKKSGTSDNEIKELYSQIYEYVKDSKIYLDSNLTLNILSEKMGLSRHKVSEAINRESKKRFYLFINDFRLREFIDAIKTDRYPSFTIISIAYECGFGSSSGFYNMVKNEYGVTPKALVEEIRGRRAINI